MLKKYKKVIPPLFFILTFVTVIFTVDYPSSLAQASFKQISVFFTPLFLFLIFTINLILKSYYRSFVLSLGLILLLLLKAFDSLNIVTFIITIFGVFLLMGNISFKKN